MSFSYEKRLLADGSEIIDIDDHLFSARQDGRCPHRICQDCLLPTTAQLAMGEPDAIACDKRHLTRDVLGTM
ncbi:MAG: hypothetical protein B7Z41_02855 [Rhizobiales bacterium 12-66-7]|nr:MAG: hypothetical protein B7Z41_02855 [Rhizobiales bacterium 12-66-7]